MSERDGRRRRSTMGWMGVVVTVKDILVVIEKTWRFPRHVFKKGQTFLFFSLPLSLATA